jgi:sulfate permease, SulP family
MLHFIRKDWFSSIRGDTLAGLVVALALIPEAIAFSIIAGVDPKVGLYASFSMAVVIAFAGGRPGMISAATGAMALLMVTLVKEHGLQYLLAATVLTGVLQIVAGMLRLDLLMRFVSRSVVTGFVNALAILGGVRHDRRRSGHHLSAAAGNPRHPVAAGHHRGAHRDRHVAQPGRAYGG